jgi:TetR/AcrR family transcriptional repressor of nem operon
MARSLPATRNEIIELADQLIRKKGFHGFSYADISGIMDVRNAAIHYHFPSKSGLGIGVIEEELKRMAISRGDWAGLPGDEQVKKLMQVFFDSSRRGEICLTGALTPDFDTLTPEMQEKVAEMCETILDWMGACLEKGRDERTLHFHGKVRDRALLLMSCLVSSLLLSRVLGETVFDRMMDQLLKDLGTSPASWVEKGPDWLL